MFYVGQEVECIDDNWDPLGVYGGNPYPPLPKLGSRYKIIGIEPPIPFFSFKNCDHLILLEFSQSSFACEHFRPIQKKQTDISIFTAMLNTTKELV